MRVAIVHDSETGTTQAMAELLAERVRAAGHECSAESWEVADPQLVSSADAIAVGSWVKGLFIVRQHPTPRILRFIDRLDDLTGKQAAVFATYRVAIGGTLRELAQHLERRGAVVTGRFGAKGPFLPDGIDAWIDGLDGAGPRR